VYPRLDEESNRKCADNARPNDATQADVAGKVPV
jgi:hypothetical protein